MTFTSGEVVLLAIVAVLVAVALEVGMWLGAREERRRR